MLARPGVDGLERELSFDVEPVYVREASLARETKAELHDFVARLRQLAGAEFRIAFIDHLRRPLDRDLRRCKSREARDDLAELLLPRRRQDVDGFYIIEILAGIRE